MAEIEELYKNFGILADAGEKAGDHVESYQAILNATKGSLPQKKLACQFIPRFFKYFPALAESAIDAQLDLCEEEETPVRRMAIKSLPDFCKTATEHIPRITDILTQLLQQEDASELVIVRSGLEALIVKDPEAALGGIFTQICVGDDLVREKAINFLTQAAPGKTFASDEKAGQFLLLEVRKMLSDVTGDEFTGFVSMLTKVKSIASNPQNLADLITEQANLDKQFEPSEPESLDRLITCTRQASPFFLRGASPAKYLEYLFKNVLPVLDQIVSTDAGDYKYEVLKLIAELSGNATAENAKEHILAVYTKLLEYMPLPSDGSIEESEEDAIQKLNFSFVECLLYAVHKLGAKNVEFFTAEESAERLKDFRQRLQYFGRMVQAYIKQLRTVLQGKPKAELEQAENKIKVMALTICNNANNMIKDFLHNPPSYKSHAVLSWKSKTTPVQPADESVTEKRKRAGITPISLDNLPPKKDKSGGKGGVYSLPTQRKGVQMDDNYVGRRKSWGNNGNNRGRFNRRGRGSYRGYRGGSGGGNSEKHENFLLRS